MVSLATSVGGVRLECCIYNASGPRSGTSAALAKVAASASGAVLAKSVTLVAQTGNPMPRYKEYSLGENHCVGSINSEGLPNPGIDYFLKTSTVDEIFPGAEGGVGTPKPFFLSLSGLSLKDNLAMLDKLADSMEAGDTTRVSAVELNLACPNIPGKPTVAYSPSAEPKINITAWLGLCKKTREREEKNTYRDRYDFEQTAQVLAAVTAHRAFHNDRRVPLGVKLAPYFDVPHYKAVAAILNQYAEGGVLRFVTTMNTIGNALIVDAEGEMAAIAPKAGFGGLGGGWVKPVALANVRQLRQLLDERLDVVGVGGVRTGRDAFEHILCGASAVQVGTQHWTEGAPCFTRIANELEQLMKDKGYTSLDDFRGKLREYDKTRNKRAPKTADGGKSKQGDKANVLVSPQVLLPTIALLLAIIGGLLLQ